MKNKENLIILILAGGQASRLKFVDKGLMKYQGKYLIEYILEVAKNFSDNIIISANRNLNVYQQFANTITDINKNFPGPMEGIFTLLNSTFINNQQTLLILPCDMPNIDNVLLGILIKQHLSNNNKLTSVKFGDKIQPLICLFDLSLKQNFNDFYQHNQSFYKFLLSNKAQFLELTENNYYSLNTNDLSFFM